jgi:hypothetical protein
MTERYVMYGLPDNLENRKKAEKAREQKQLEVFRAFFKGKYGQSAEQLVVGESNKVHVKAFNLLQGYIDSHSEEDSGGSPKSISFVMFWRNRTQEETIKIYKLEMMRTLRDGYADIIYQKETRVDSPFNPDSSCMQSARVGPSFDDENLFTLGVTNFFVQRQGYEVQTELEVKKLLCLLEPGSAALNALIDAESAAGAKPEIKAKSESLYRSVNPGGQRGWIHSPGNIS